MSSAARSRAVPESHTGVGNTKRKHKVPFSAAPLVAEVSPGHYISASNSLVLQHKSLTSGLDGSLIRDVSADSKMHQDCY